MNDDAFGAVQAPTPLPVRVRCFHGEGLASYTRRAAAANHVEAKEVESALRSQGFSFPGHRDSAARQQIWRALGKLHPSVFKEQGKDGVYDVPSRTLCLKCSAGLPADGRMSAFGDVCLRHQRWLGYGDQVDVSGTPEFAAAERTFRRVLAPRGLLVGNVVFMDSRAVGQCLPDDTVQSRCRGFRKATTNYELLGYPETVAVASMLTDPGFLDQVMKPGPVEQRREFLVESVRAAVQPIELVESWRLLNPLWNLLRCDYEKLTSAMLRGSPPETIDAATLPFWTSRPIWERT